MDITSALKRTWREDITLRSIIASTVWEYYTKKIGSVLEIQSVQIRGKKILIKTGNPLLNSQLVLLQWDIEELLQKRFGDMKLSLWKEIDLRFI